jgi:hypothetical protein
LPCRWWFATRLQQGSKENQGGQQTDDFGVCIQAICKEQVSFESLRTVRDPEALGQFVAGLDTALELVPPIVCTPKYNLRFTLADGTLYDLSYGCGDDGSAVLRGTQPFWREMEVHPPAEFSNWIETQN